MATIHHGDCLEVMRSLPDASVDAIVTDPPYGLEFMGKSWDAPWQESGVNADAGFSALSMADGYERLPRPSFTGSTNPKCLTCKGTRRGRRDGTAKVAVCLCADGGKFPNHRAVEMRAFQQWCELWTAECLRVLKPGGHLLAFGGTRTWHRLVVAVEDAGFEIRDSIAWLYGSGFSKGGLMGNKAGLTWCDCGPNALPYNHAPNTDLPRVRQDVHPSPESRGEGQDAVLLAPVQRTGEGQGVGQACPQGQGGMVTRGGGICGREDARREEPGMGGRLLHRTGEGLPHGTEAGAPEGQGERLRGRAPARHGGDDRASGHAAGGSAPHQPGPGGQPTGEPEALPGSHEPLDDGTRRGRVGCPRCGGLDPAFRGFSTTLKPSFEPIVVARKPLVGTVAVNVLAHGTGAVNVDACRVDMGAEYDAARVQRQSAATAGMNGLGQSGYAATHEQATYNAKGRWPTNVVLDGHAADALDEQSGTSRFFPTFRYQAKAPARERPRVDGVAHPTVKPLDLMRWLVRLVTPPGGVILDPFAGSGTTVEAALLEGFACIAIEREADYLPLIHARIDRAAEAPPLLPTGL